MSERDSSEDVLHLLTFNQAETQQKKLGNGCGAVKNVIHVPTATFGADQLLLK